MSKRKIKLVLTALIIMLSFVAVFLLLWGRSPAKAAVRIDAAPASVSPVMQLRPGSRWYGTLSLENCRGDGPLSNGSRAVWGFLDSSSDGSTYFELSEKQRPAKNDVPLLSFWCELGEDSLTAQIGEQDAWIFEQWLTEADTEVFSLHLENGALGTEFDYDDGTQQCHLRFTLRPA